MSEQEVVTTSSTQDAVASISWRVKLCHWLRRVLFFVWGTLFVNIIIGTIANLNTTTTDTPLSKLYIIHIAITYPLLTVGMVGMLLVLTVVSWICSYERSATPSLPPSEQNRLHLLQRIRSTYDDLMIHSLQDAAWLELGLASKPGVVQNASTLLLRTSDQSEHLLPVGTSIVEVYEQANHELLILGEPGAGKSMLLLRLAQHLVEQAVQDITRPLPVILPLSSWAVKRLPFQEWLSEQFSLMYNVPRRFGQKWVKEEYLLLLLDGLDEMEESARAACIVAINAYHHDHLQPLVICSRTEGYTHAAASEQLALQHTVVVQPLTLAQINDYLVQAGRPLTALRVELRKNSKLAALATTPLMLHILILIYHGTSVKQLSQKGELLRQQIWTDYVQYVIERRGDMKRYPRKQTIAWLTWLARQMNQHNQTVFYIEQIQPDWLLENQSRRLYCAIVGGLVYGQVSGLIVGLVYSLVSGLIADLFLLHFDRLVFILVCMLAFTLIGGLIGGLVGGLINARDTEIKPTEVIVWSWVNMRWRLAEALIIGLVGWLVFKLIGLLVFTLVGSPASLWVSILIFILPYVLTGGVVGSLFNRSSSESLDKHNLVMPHRSMLRSIRDGVLMGLAVLLGVSLLGFQTTILDLRLLNNPAGELIVELIIGLESGFVVGLIVGLFSGLSRDKLNEHYKMVPNEGIRRSAWNGILVGLVGGLLSGLVSGFIYGLLSGLAYGQIQGLVRGLVIGLIVGLSVGLIVGLWNGGTACIKHAVLRWLLWHTKHIPWNYSSFLDYTAEHILLRKVRGGYIFVHRLLLEYFTSLDSTATPNEEA